MDRVTKGSPLSSISPFFSPTHQSEERIGEFFRIRCQNTLNLTSDPLSYNLAVLNGSVSTSLPYVKVPQSRAMQSSSLFSLLVNNQFFLLSVYQLLHPFPFEKLS